MDKKKIWTRSMLLVTICFGFMISVQNQRISASFPGEFYYSESFKWKIDFISEGNIVWWNVSSFAFVADWHAENSSDISFIVSDHATIGDKDYLIGEINIGNLTLQTNDQDIAFNLALSVYPWYGGLVSLEENWEELQSKAPLDNTTLAEVIYQKPHTVLGQLVEAVEINYDDGFQTSSFIYEPFTGILLSAITTSGAFHFEMHLTNSTVPLPGINTGLPGIGFYSIFVCLALIVIAIKWKSKKG
jgi:hypothetical protein